MKFPKHERGIACGIIFVCSGLTWLATHNAVLAIVVGGSLGMLLGVYIANKCCGGNDES